jgi:hypothetical protein
MYAPVFFRISTTSPVVCETQYTLQFDITIESLVCRWLAMVASARTTPTMVGAHAPLYGALPRARIPWCRLEINLEIGKSNENSHSPQCPQTIVSRLDAP